MPKTPRLKEFRDRASLAQQELAELSGVSRATIADAEAGNRTLQPRTLRKLAEALETTPVELTAAPKKVAAPNAQKTWPGAEHYEGEVTRTLRRDHPLLFMEQEEYTALVESAGPEDLDRISADLAQAAQFIQANRERCTVREDGEEVEFMHLLALYLNGRKPPIMLRKAKLHQTINV